MLYDEEAFKKCCPRNEAERASKHSLQNWAEATNLGEKGHVFFTNLKSFKKCRSEIEKIAKKHLNGRVASIPWIGKGTTLLQLCPSFEELYKKAEKAKPAFATIVRNALASANVEEDVFLFPALKGKIRAKQKAANEYHGDFSRLVDIVRGACIFETEDALVEFYQALNKNPEIEMLRVKNRFNPPNFNGYRDLLTNVSVCIDDAAFICELQIHLSQIKNADALYDSHLTYEYFREYFSGNMAAVQTRLDALLGLPVAGVRTIAELVENILKEPSKHDLNALLDLLAYMSEYENAKKVRRYLLDKEAEKDTESLAYADALNEMALMHLATGELELAENGFRDVLLIYQKHDGGNGKGIPETFVNLANVLYKQSKAELAEKCSTIAIAYLQKRNDTDCPMMASALNTLGTVCSHLKKFGDAKTALLKAKDIREKLNGSKHESVAVIDNNLGLLCVELKDFAAARRHYDSALQTWTRCLGQDHPLVAKV